MTVRCVLVRVGVTNCTGMIGKKYEISSHASSMWLGSDRPFALIGGVVCCTCTFIGIVRRRALQYHVVIIVWDLDFIPLEAVNDKWPNEVLYCTVHELPQTNRGSRAQMRSRCRLRRCE